MNRLLIVGGDMRYVHLAECFAAENKNVSVCGFGSDIVFSPEIHIQPHLSEAAKQADVIILPLPASHDKVTVNTPLCDECLYLKDIYINAKAGTIVCLGKYDTEIFKAHNLLTYDYSVREDFAYLNAVPTCEGAINAAMNILETTIFSSKVLVCGFGRCAKITAMTLSAMGAHVTVAARSVRDLSFAQALGLDSVNITDLQGIVKNYDIIFNTVPHMIFTENILKNLKRTCPLIDVASVPGGADSKTAGTLGICYHFLPGLPGKYSPKSAAMIIQKTINNIISESGKDVY